MCSQQESLLPEININGTLNPTKSTKKSKAVLITSLYPEYSEKLKSMYYEHTTVTGQGLAGLKPWILLTPRDQKPAVPPCTRAVSMEPCFQVPPTYDCRAKKNADLGALVRHVTHCEDVEQGIKLVD
ncbi:fucosyltransferase 2 [Rhynchospora pubera]|uniref:Fucosyltransferase n=1 Tax=Rhynchospora pubera TaxID=906938 RepID=A0AAV8CYR1_9POAL|nr:fucosyltransferase 2 [Rhynchospora pubera]